METNLYWLIGLSVTVGVLLTATVVVMSTALGRYYGFAQMLGLGFGLSVWLVLIEYLRIKDWLVSNELILLLLSSGCP